MLSGIGNRAPLPEDPKKTSPKAILQDSFKNTSYTFINVLVSQKEYRFFDKKPGCQE
jgi:hypothetical protein